MVTDWIPNGHKDKYDPTKDVQEMNNKVETFNEKIEEKMKELD
jgi:peptidoglycan hydrolase CwlO-like protein